jgi:hypothetical protein
VRVRDNEGLVPDRPEEHDADAVDWVGADRTAATLLAEPAEPRADPRPLTFRALAPPRGMGVVDPVDHRGGAPHIAWRRCSVPDTRIFRPMNGPQRGEEIPH